MIRTVTAASQVAIPFKVHLLTAVMLSCGLGPVVAWGDSFEWAEPASGVFDQASNWNRLFGRRLIPEAGDGASFNEAGTYEVLFNSPHETGVLTLDAGDVTFRGNGAAQTYTITGGGADVSVLNGSLSLGGEGEALGLIVSDDLSVTHGGTLNVFFESLLDVTGNVTVGQLSGTSSTIVVDGPESRIQFADRLNLGAAQATGTLTLSNDASGVIGGVVNLASSLTNNVTGRLNVLSGATLETGSIDVAAPLLLGTNLDGELTVDGRNSRLTMTGPATLKIGKDGHRGVVTVSDEGDFFTGTGGTIVGNGGTLSIDGSASSFDFQTEFDAKGGLVVESGGTLAVQNAWLRVTGDLDNTSGGVFDFRYGRIQVAGGTFSPADTTFTIASTVPDESLDLTMGNGSTWTNAQSITVGGSNAGTLFVSGSGAVTTTDLDVRENGRLFMSFDSQLNTTSADVRGSATIGSGSFFNTATWTNTDRIDILGELTVRTGGEIIVEELNPSGTGSLILDGGSVIATRIWDPFDFRRGSVTLNSDIQIGGIALQPFESSLTLGPQQHLVTPNTTQIRPFNALTLDGGSLTTNSLDVDGEFHFQSGGLELTGGTLHGLDHLTVPTGGEFRATGNYSISILGVPGSTIEATGDLTIGDASKLNGFGSAGNLEVRSHTVVLQDANDVVFDSLALVTLGQFSSPGTLTAGNGLTLDFGGNITGHGTLDTPNDPLQPTIINGSVQGKSSVEPITLNGFVKGVGTLENVVINGTLSPGFSPAAVRLGNTRYAGELEIEIGGHAAGSQFDQLNHVLGNGLVELGGTLDVQLINGFEPASGDSFEIITAASVVNQFTQTQLPTLDQLRWEVLYGANSVLLNVLSFPDCSLNGVLDAADLACVNSIEDRDTILQAINSLPGDLDGDGQVAFSDFLILADNFNQVDKSYSEGNIDLVGVVAFADFLTLSNHFGKTPADVTAVPEPDCWTFAVLAVCCLPGLRFRNRGKRARNAAA